MTIGYDCFNVYLRRIELLMQDAENELDPALYLYSHDCRTPLFMLEALSRIYGGMHNNNIFKKLNKKFKGLEDAIGGIDYYDYFAKAFQQHPLIPVYVREYMQEQTKEKLQSANDILFSDGWLGEDANRIKKIRKKLRKIDWLSPKEEVRAIVDFYDAAIKDIKKFILKTGDPFNELEDGVHELRRDLRWLSIYPQALQGTVQLVEIGSPTAALRRYMVPEITHSKFNVMPDAGTRQHLLLISKNHFYALSWMIAETGKIKDQGLEYYAIAEALHKCDNISDEEALEKAFQLLKVEGNKMQLLLAYATEITNRYIKEENLDKLIVGTVRNKNN